MFILIWQETTTYGGIIRPFSWLPRFPVKTTSGANDEQQRQTRRKIFWTCGPSRLCCCCYCCCRCCCNCCCWWWCWFWRGTWLSLIYKSQNSIKIVGSGCGGSVGISVICDARGLQFEFSHQQVSLFLTVLKRLTEKKIEAGNFPILDRWSSKWMTICLFRVSKLGVQIMAWHTRCDVPWHWWQIVLSTR